MDNKKATIKVMESVTPKEQKALLDGLKRIEGFSFSLMSETRFES